MSLNGAKGPTKPSQGGSTMPCANSNLPTDAGGKTVRKLNNGDIQIGKNITISGTDGFKGKALADLVAVGKTETGKNLLTALDDGTHRTRIKELDMARAQRNGALAGPTDRAGAKDATKGSDTEISYNPDVKLQVTDQNGDKHDYPPKSLLAHEMIHAVHNDRGTNLRDTPDPKETGSNQEESQTIGINDYKDATLTENNLLGELGVGWKRTDHDLSAVVPTMPPAVNDFGPPGVLLADRDGENLQNEAKS